MKKKESQKISKLMKISAVSVVLLGAGLILASRSGAVRWKNGTARMTEELYQEASQKEIDRTLYQKLDSLPAPVKRYFKFALGEQQPMIRTARLRHAGTFYLSDKWIPFESEENFSVLSPGFVWDAKMKISPVTSVRVRDGYRDGQGFMQAKALSLYTLVDAGGSDDKLAAGELQRYLAEAVWLPPALLPSNNLHWSAISDTSARATLTDSGVTVSLDFEFGETGEVTTVFSPARFRLTGKEYKSLPWRGRFRNYQNFNGMMIPTEGEVEWQMPEGNLPYWRGTLLEADYCY